MATHKYKAIDGYECANGLLVEGVILIDEKGESLIIVSKSDEVLGYFKVDDILRIAREGRAEFDNSIK